MFAVFTDIFTATARGFGTGRGRAGGGEHQGLGRGKSGRARTWQPSGGVALLLPPSASRVHFLPAGASRDRRQDQHRHGHQHQDSRDNEQQRMDQVPPLRFSPHLSPQRFDGVDADHRPFFFFRLSARGGRGPRSRGTQSRSIACTGRRPSSATSASAITSPT